MRAYARALRVALGFLTTLPVPLICDWRDDDLRLAVRAYPVVGAVIGGLLLSLLWLLQPFGTLLTACMVVAAWLLVTGALHFDGFCDLADAAFASKSSEERWRIVKDPRIGSFALAAGVLYLIIKIAALTELITRTPTPLVILIVPVIARSAVTWSMARFPVYDASLLGRQSRLSWSETLLPIGFGLFFSVAVMMAQLLILAVMLAVGVVVTVLVSHWLNRRMQGLGGDAYGAIVEVNEVALLVALSVI